MSRILRCSNWIQNLDREIRCGYVCSALARLTQSVVASRLLQSALDRPRRKTGANAGSSAETMATPSVVYSVGARCCSQDARVDVLLRMTPGGRLRSSVLPPILAGLRGKKSAIGAKTGLRSLGSPRNLSCSSSACCPLRCAVVFGEQTIARDIHSTQHSGHRLGPRKRWCYEVFEEGRPGSSAAGDVYALGCRKGGASCSGPAFVHPIVEEFS